MSGLPPTNPIYVLTTALYAALSPLVELVEGVPAYHWLQATEAASDALKGRRIPGMLLAFPSTPEFKVAQSFIGDAQVSGVIIVKSLAHDDDAAQALLAQAVEALAGELSPPDGYACQLDWLSEPVLPPNGGIWQAAASYRATVRRAA